MKKVILYFFLLSMTLLILVNPSLTIENAKSALKLCYDVIFPSLFPFFVLSGLLVYSGFFTSLSKIFSPVMKPLFNINSAGAAAFILGIASGYPLGALTACQLYESGYLSKEEAERLLGFCNNSGPLFILGAVGVSLYHSLKLGIILYLSHLLSALTVGFIMRFYKKNRFAPHVSAPTNSLENIGTIFSRVLANSINSILTVCGTIVFLSVISRALLELIPAKGITYSLVLGAMEFVSGISEISHLNIPILLKLLFTSWVVGFAGVSVHLQVMAIVSKYNLSLIPYIFGKIMQGAISLIYTFILYNIINPVILASYNNTLSYSFFASSFFVILSVVFIVVLLIPTLFILHKKGTKNPSF